MFVVTGATGNIGSKVTEILLSRGEKVRVVGREAGKLQSFVARGAEAAAGDLKDSGFLTRAFSGATAAFALIPFDYAARDFRAFQDEVGTSIAAAIRDSGITEVVNLSGQGADLPDWTGPVKGLHDQEERLNKLAGGNILHIRPTFFMENLLMHLSTIEKMGMASGAIRGDIKFAMIATGDVAAFAADRLVRRDFVGKSVRDLLGQRDISMNEAMAVIGRKIGRPGLKYLQIPYADAERGLVKAGLSEDMSRLYIEMSRALNEGLFAVNRARSRDNTAGTPIEEFADFFARVYFLGKAKVHAAGRQYPRLSFVR